ncbi:lecithin:cholesterol acyltransferase [Nitzschia inconspicua]|uniref:Lecithin:cholesterol acyltransferase n=1 Tax=Nitzschia inconspicua TaxID=303405 RepID=A0A9K3K513_9STRA|nr:lecithin:cholesterol acyltransferase [Nitzschia inconspicua]
MSMTVNQICAVAVQSGILDHLHPRFSLVDRVNEALRRLTENMDEEEILRRTSAGRLRIGLSDSGYFPFFRANQQEAYVFVDEFESIQEILAACVLSSYVPGLTGPAPLKRSIQLHPAVMEASSHLKQMLKRGVIKDRNGNRRDRLCKDNSEFWDGGLVNLFPTINKASILVTPFGGTFNNPTISPRMVTGVQQHTHDDPQNKNNNFFSIPKVALAVNNYASLDVSMENLRTLRYMAMSSTDEALQLWFSQGYDTCQKFLSDHSMQNKFSIVVPQNNNNCPGTMKIPGKKRSLHTITDSHLQNELPLQYGTCKESRNDDNTTMNLPTDTRTVTTRNRYGAMKYALAAIAMMLCWVPCMAIDHDLLYNQNNQSAHIGASILSQDPFEDSFLDPISYDPSCLEHSLDDCNTPPASTIEQEVVTMTKWDATCFKGGEDIPEEEEDNPDSFELAVKTSPKQCPPKESTETKTVRVDKHWGKDPSVLQMRDLLLNRSLDSLNDSRPPIFLLPGLASTRLVAWRIKKCASAISKEIKVQENVWLNMNLVIRMGTMDVDCMKECLKLGRNQSDTDVWEKGCKLRPDEGLDSISSLSPAGLGAELLVGGTNTVYAWLIQWLVDNLGYDVTTIIGLPYDWRLSPNKMEKRDGFLQAFRRRLEAAVATQGQPGIMVAHSMGNLVFRYFLEWLRVQMRQEVYAESSKRQRRRAESWKRQRIQQMQQKNMQPNIKGSEEASNSWASYIPGWLSGAPEEPPRDPYIKTNSQKEENTEIDTESQLWELAKEEGDEKFFEWLEKHIWTYVGLSPPLLGAVNPLRAVLSGENMGLPMHDSVAREMELTFGSTNTLNPISTANGFCDKKNSLERQESSSSTQKVSNRHSTLACLDDIAHDIKMHSAGDPWANFPALESLLSSRLDWDSGKPMISIELEKCYMTDDEDRKNKPSCQIVQLIKLGPNQVEDASIFDTFNYHWKEEEEPLVVKKEQLMESFMNSSVLNILNHTWDRPLIKHVIMAYGVDVPTEVGYIYGKDIDKTTERGIPNLKAIIRENPGGELTLETLSDSKGGFAGVFSNKPKYQPFNFTNSSAQLAHSGDGSVPYLSLSWAHTWLLHAARARRYTEDKNRGKPGETHKKKNALDYIHVSHRPCGELDWIDGPPPAKKEGVDKTSKTIDDTGTSHPHGTRYKPLMKKFHNVGVSRTTGIEYTTSIVEAVGIEHKETTRNYDILAAVFTDIVKFMHDDFGLASEKEVQ